MARFQTSLAQSLPKIAGVCVLVAADVALGMVLNRPPWHAVLMPLTVTAMVLTMAYNPQFALLMSFSLTLADRSRSAAFDHLLIHMGGMATAVLSAAHVRTHAAGRGRLLGRPGLLRS